MWRIRRSAILLIQLACAVGGLSESHGVIDKCFADIRFGEHDEQHWELDADVMVQREEAEYLEFDENGGARSFVHTHESDTYAPIYTQRLLNVTRPARITFWARMSSASSQLHVAFIRSGVTVVHVKALGNTLLINNHTIHVGIKPQTWFHVCFYLTGWQQSKGLTISTPLSHTSSFTIPSEGFSGIDQIATWGGGNPTWVDLLKFDCVFVPPSVYQDVQNHDSLEVKLQSNEGSFNVFKGDSLFFTAAPDCYLSQAIPGTTVPVTSSTTDTFRVSFPSPDGGYPSRGQRYFLCYKTHDEGFLRLTEDGHPLVFQSSLTPSASGCELEPLVGTFSQVKFDCGLGTKTFVCTDGAWDADPYAVCAAGVFDLPIVEGGLLINGSCSWDRQTNMLEGCKWASLPGTSYTCENDEGRWDVTKKMFVGTFPKCTRGCFRVEGATLADGSVPAITPHSTTLAWKRMPGYTCNEKWSNRLTDSRDIDLWTAKCNNGVWKRISSFGNTIITCHKMCPVAGQDIEGAKIIDQLHEAVPHLEDVRWMIVGGYGCDTVLTQCVDGVLGKPKCAKQNCKEIEGMSYTCQATDAGQSMACRYHALPDSMCAKWLGYQLGPCDDPQVDCTKSATCSVSNHEPEGAWSPCLQQKIISSSASCAWRPFEGYYCNTLITSCGTTGYLTSPECTFKCATEVAGTVTNCSSLVPLGEFCLFSAAEGYACTVGVFPCSRDEWPVRCSKIADRTPVPTAESLKGSAVQFSMEVLMTLEGGLNDNEEVTNDVSAAVVKAIADTPEAPHHLVLESVQVVKICGISNDTYHSVNTFTCVYPVPHPTDLPPLNTTPLNYYLEFSFSTLSTSTTARVTSLISSVLHPNRVLTSRATINIAPTIKTTTVVFTPRPAWSSAPATTPASLVLFAILLLPFVV